MNHDKSPKYNDDKGKRNSRSPGKLLAFSVPLTISMMFSLRHLNSSFNFRSVLGPFRCHHGAATAGGLPTHYILNNGAKIPSVALGQRQTGPAVKKALNAGYRHIDGAWIYRLCQTLGLKVPINLKLSIVERKRGRRSVEGKRGTEGSSLAGLQAVG
ncbi:aldehyde reductase i [Moniliophthora roreri MCA 2997]|uniref:Aldehyde reductase i n=1 Tax=Moniliophthora roreri (strain MCA 2997) TaxID=1381753 RepID=V2WDA9_MONRO|nr:aldehyde reductase i [Moniliophthora roreri MCA 2997]